MKEEKQESKSSYKLSSRMDVIGQNGNTGEHYGESGPMEFSNIEYNENEFDDYGQRIITPCVGHAQASDELLDAEDEIGYIASTIAYAQEDDLLPEVIYQALLEMKQNPDLSPSEALQFGYSEWCK